MSTETEIVPLGIDFNQPLLDMNGDPIKQRTEDDSVEELTLGSSCVTALMITLQDDKSDGVQKLKRFNLAQKIKGKNVDDDYATVHLNSKQKKLITDQAERAYSTLIYARMYELLEGSTEDSEDE